MSETEYHDYRWRMKQDEIDDCEATSHPAPTKVAFSEEVTVFYIERRTQEDIEELFWSEDDYVRMRSEDQIMSTRRKRSRVRDMKRRMVESSKAHDGGDDLATKDNKQQLEDYHHSDSMRLTMNRLDRAKMIANAA